MEESRDFRKLQIREFPKKALRGTAEGRFWRKFKSVKAVQQPGAVTHVEFCDCAPHDLAVTSSTRAYSGSLRQDGKALVAGGETGIIQVLDAGSRLVLRQLKGHSRAVHFSRYAEDKVHIFSAGDDNTARWWDASSEESLLRLGGHTDYVRCGATGGASRDVWATGSYDHTVRLWDIRTGKCVMQLQHGRPLEDVAFFPSGGLFVSAGANYMNIWDIIAGGRLLKRVSNHQKTITSVQVSSPLGVATQSTVIGGDGPRLISASLDGHVKVYELDSFKTTHSSRYPAPILSMAVSPTLQTLAVGLSTGLLSIRKMKVQTTEAKTEELDSDAPWWKRRKERAVRKTRYYRANLNDQRMETTDYEVAQRKPVRISEFDKLLKGFNHKEALIAALECKHPDTHHGSSLCQASSTSRPSCSGCLCGDAGSFIGY
ncbi:hypothetical protein CBR_g11128 [Chara braunii]|uniref:Uncharacterized protein n=1 Tax=Chara braunii TaxID=69332 RepID=A0A388KQ75_CHABU|nr:hypothetical protein CBR_g11128 [Chara braunii]|eukprot:GBG72196.1 hypothetical protein CBR_g11128 [Chara braunii]